MSKISKCYHCGKPIDFDNEFCRECGEEIKVIHCKDCDFIGQDYIKFCVKCGSKNLELIKPQKISDQEYWTNYLEELSKYI